MDALGQHLRLQEPGQGLAGHSLHLQGSILASFDEHHIAWSCSYKHLLTLAIGIPNHDVRAYQGKSKRSWELRNEERVN